MQRKFTADLLKWKESKDRKPLMVYGVRQVGKSWLMKDFGANYYKNVAYVTFDNNPRAKAIFNDDFDAKRIIRELEIETNTRITPGETLIILDEIQTCKRAVTSLKYFNEDAAEYHVMVAGSLLGVMTFEEDEKKDNVDTGFPVGKVDRITIYPMNFLEFLTALGEERFTKLIQDLDFKTISTFADKISDFMKLYFYVGGMPAAVKKYVDTRFLPDVQDIQHNLINDYYADFAKHVPKEDIAKVRKLWDSVPLQLGKENKRFLYSDLKKGSRGRDYETALQWLLDAGMAYKINRISRPNMPLKAYSEDNVFKLYMPDIGLLSALTALDLRAYLEPNNAIFNHYKGVLAEQFVLQELRASNERLPIYFWANETNRAEIEFILQLNNKIIPIEVKSGKSVKSESLRSYITKKDFAAEVAVRASLLNYRLTNNVHGTRCVLHDIPLYTMGIFTAQM
ncbi:MAG: ATP-binding protein [Fibromonadaceae bacterium]|jgi:predicted AAA+ superfamily ATPase|nr:ATP-binding protein [Fibromonadaceae bacterium]